VQTILKREAKVTAARMVGLFWLFFLISWGLGYPILNRYDPRQTPGLTDVRMYATLTAGIDADDAGHVRFRVLVPLVARPFYLVAKGRSGSWDPVMFGLLVSDSLFVAGTALLIVVLGTCDVDGYLASLVAALLYLVNFAVPNLRLAGLVDAGEGFFLLALLWSLSEQQFWALPLISALGALTKESFVPFSIVFTAAWWIVAGNKSNSAVRKTRWIMVSWVASIAAFSWLHWHAGGPTNPIKFALSLHGNHEYLHHFGSSLWDRNFWYIFLWLLPLGIPRLPRFPKSWLIPIAMTSTTAFILDGYYGGAPGTVGRALFSIVGPLLALSSASLICSGVLQSWSTPSRP
jgi:hypothetical protein